MRMYDLVLDQDGDPAYVDRKGNVSGFSRIGTLLRYLERDEIAYENSDKCLGYLLPHEFIVRSNEDEK